MRLTWVRAAQGLIVALVLLALLRAVTLELDPYDGYEVRTSARAVAGVPGAPFLVYRSALLTLAEAPFERWARDARVTWIFPHVLTTLAYAALALGAVALARAAGASRDASWAAGVAVALDRLAWADAPLGLPDGLAAALATGGLARGLALLETPTRRRLLETGALLGLAAAARPNAALACGALALGGLLLDLDVARRPDFRAAKFRWARGRLATAVLAGALAVLVYFTVATLVFALGRGSLTAGLAAHSDLVTFQKEQLAENARKYGSAFSPLSVYLRASFFMEPVTILLLPLGLSLSLLKTTRDFFRAKILALTALFHFAFLCCLVGHGEARYLLPGLVPLAALAALALDALARRFAAHPRLPLVRALVALAWVGLPLALGARSEGERATDPVFRHNFSEHVAREVERAGPPTARVLWAPDLPFPVYPSVLGREGTPFRGDPFHGICHAGPLTVSYHLGRPILLLHREAPGPRGSMRDELRGLARAGVLHPGDLVLVGVDAPALSWTITATQPTLDLLEITERTRDSREPAPSSASAFTEHARIGPW